MAMTVTWFTKFFLTTKKTFFTAQLLLVVLVSYPFLVLSTSLSQSHPVSLQITLGFVYFI